MNILSLIGTHTGTIQWLQLAAASAIDIQDDCDKEESYRL